MKFILFTDSPSTKKRVLATFAEVGRDIIFLSDPEALFKSVEEATFPLVLIDVKFSRFPAFGLSKEIKGRFASKNVKTFLIMPPVEDELKGKISESWMADGVIAYNEIEKSVMELLKQFPFIKQGGFKEKPFLPLLLEIRSKNFTGTLTVNREGEEKGIYFENGTPKYAITSRREEKIGEFLVRFGKIKEEEKEAILNEARSEGKRLGEFLVQKGILDKSELRQILRRQMEEIFCSIFSWDDAVYTLTDENIAVQEDVLLEKTLEELIYHGVMKYGKVGGEKWLDLYPKLTRGMDEVRGMYPLNDREVNLLELLDGTENVGSLSFKSDCTHKEIVRLCYLLKESGLLELLAEPVRNGAKRALGKIQTKSFRIEEVPVVEDRGSGEESRALEEMEEPPATQPESEYKDVANWRRGIVVTAIVLVFVVILAVSSGIIIHKRAESRLWNEKINYSNALINTDDLPALKNAVKILEDCIGNKYRNNNLTALLAFANLRMYEQTGERQYLDKAKGLLDISGEGHETDEIKPVTALLSIANGDLSRAGSILSEIKEADQPIALYAMARYAIEKGGEPRSAVDLLFRLSQQDMRVIKIEIANAFSLLGDLESLKRILFELRRDIPGHPDVVMLSGDQRFLEGNYQEAEALYRLSLESRQVHIPTTIRLARVHLALNKPEQAISEIEPVLMSADIRSNCGKQARLIYARALAQLKKIEMAKEILQQLASVFPEDKTVKEELTTLEKEMERRVTKKDTPSELLRKAKNLYQKGEYEKAVKVFEKGLGGADDEYLYWYALTLKQMGDSARAFLQLKKAEGKNPENPLVHKELGAIYKEMGKEEESRTHFQLYMKYIKK